MALQPPSLLQLRSKERQLVLLSFLGAPASFRREHRSVVARNCEGLSLVMKAHRNELALLNEDLKIIFGHGLPASPQYPRKILSSKFL